jgi:quinol monooxygenase YgiN
MSHTYRRFRDEEAVKAHQSSPMMAWLVETDKAEENMAAPIEMLPLHQFAGWESRS